MWSADRLLTLFARWKACHPGLSISVQVVSCDYRVQDKATQEIRTGRKAEREDEDGEEDQARWAAEDVDGEQGRSLGQMFG